VVQTISHALLRIESQGAIWCKKARLKKAVKYTPFFQPHQFCLFF
jgi:hypothetical protein